MSDQTNTTAEGDGPQDHRSLPAETDAAPAQDLDSAADLLVAIAEDDSFLHVGSLDELVVHGRVHRADPGSAGPSRSLEFYDVEGARLRPALDTDFEIARFEATGERADPERLLKRMHAVLAQAEARAKGQAAVGMNDAVPQAQDSVAEQALVIHRKLYGHGPGEHRGGWFHNLMHGLG
jgi:hypothetical protein